MKKSVTLAIALSVGIATATTALQINGETIVPEPFSYADDYYTPEEHYCMSLNIYHEARAEHLAGQVAVADVTLNRVKDNRYPNNICNVVYEAQTYTTEDGRTFPRRHKCQFSWYCDGLKDDPREGRSWDRSRNIAYQYLENGLHRGITEGATHYHATYVKPDWASAEGMVLVGRIGEHIFYRWK